ncbi:MAG: YbbR-like domain-containing protein [Bacteroidales bacterium]
MAKERFTWQSIFNRVRVRDKKFRTRLSVFAICVLIAVFMWLVIKLSGNYFADVHYPIRFVNQTEGYLLTDYSDSVAIVRVNAKGFKLLNAKWFNASKTLELDINNLNTNPYTRSDNYNFYVLSNKVRGKVEDDLANIDAVVDIIPDTFFLFMDKKIRKKVPVRPKLNIRYDAQFEPYKSPSLKPDSIWIIGPQHIIESLNAVKTEELELSGVQNDVSASLKLRIPQDVEATAEKTQLTIDVEEFTERVIETPILPEADHGYQGNINTFPRKATVSFWVALKDYERVDPEQFEVIADLPDPDVQDVDQALLRITRFPAFVKKLQVSPSYVDFLIHTNEE